MASQSGTLDSHASTMDRRFQLIEAIRMNAHELLGGTHDKAGIKPTFTPHPAGTSRKVLWPAVPPLVVPGTEVSFEMRYRLVSVH